MYKILIVGRRPGNGAGHTERDEDVGNEAEYVRDFQNVLTVFTGYDPHLVLMDIHAALL